MGLKIPDFDFKGIKRIEIPKVDEDFRGKDFGLIYIKKYMPNILATHSKNVSKINYLYNYALGEQDILNKERPHEIDKENNNQTVENHALRQISFKVGFCTGERRDYTHKVDTNTDDLIYLDRYMTDSNFFTKDKDIKEWIYSVGLGVSSTTPRKDIILEDGVDELTGSARYRFANEKDGFNIDFEAPFEIDCVDPRENFVVYSSAKDKKPLLCVTIADVDLSKENDMIPKIRKQILVESRYAYFKVNSDTNFNNFEWEKVNVVPKSLKYLPLIEHSVNKERMGIVEINKGSFNLVNLLRSVVADMAFDNSNPLLVFKNVDITAEEVQLAKRAGAVIISDANNSKQNSQADIKTVTIEIPLEGFSKFIDNVLQNSYDIVGVPMASSQSTSGGDTGQARMLGGGWENAYIMVNNDINTLKASDYEQLKLMLLICRQVPNCKLDQVYSSQIDINYRVNQNDNYLVKTQGMMNLYAIDMPLEEILKSSKLFNDIKTVSKDWQARIDAKAEQKENDLMKIDNRVKDGNNS